MDGPRNRRDFLRLAAGAAAVAATGAACGSGSDKSKPNSAKAKGSAAKGDRTLRIAQSSHFVPAYDPWFDDEYARRWGEAHDMEVVVDHISAPDLQTRADAEVAGQRGHDLFAFIGPAATFEDEVIDHREIVEEIEAKVGRMTPAVERGVHNRRTGKYFAVADFWGAYPVHYRLDLWAGVEPGLEPRTWDDLLRAGPKLKAAGTPLGVGLGPGIDGTLNALALLFAYGASVQDEEGNVVLDQPATVEAVKMATAIFRAGMTEEVLSWDDAADNRFLTSGKGSLTLDPVSAIRTVEKQDPELAAKIGLRRPPAGPNGSLSAYLGPQGYVIWKFARNPEAARQFVVDLAVNYREAFVSSEYYNMPAFPGAIPDLAAIVAKDAVSQPPGKYTVLADATTWSTNLGHPGDTNPAVAEVFNEFIVPKMFIAAALGEMTPEESVRAAAAQIKPIYDKWRERGKV